MQFPWKLSVLSAERTLWVLAGLTLTFGYAGVTQSYERRIAISSNNSQVLYQKIIANQKRLAEAARAEQLRNRLRDTLSGVLVGAQGPESMASFLRDLNVLAGQHHAQVVAIEPQKATQAIPNEQRRVLDRSDVSVTSRLLHNTVLDISVRGHFSDLLELIAQLPHQHILLDVQNIRFDLSSGGRQDSQRPLLDARIRTGFYDLGKSELLGEI